MPADLFIKGAHSPSLSSSSGSSGFVKIPKEGNFIVNEEVVPLPIIMVPTWFKSKQATYFQSRENEMLQMKSCLLGPNPPSLSPSKHRSFLVVGIGGVGKSELAARFSSQYSREFDALFWLTADSVDRLTESYSKIASELGLVSSSGSNNPEHCCEVFRTWLGDPVRGTPQSEKERNLVRWLLIFDNAYDHETIQKFWPHGSHGSVVVTTRNPRLNSKHHTYTGELCLSGLRTTDAAQLLRYLANDEKPYDAQTDSDAREIVEWFQGLPLAIDQLGRIIFDHELTVSRFKKLYPSRNDFLTSTCESTTEEGNQNKRRVDQVLITSWALEKLYEQQRDAFLLLTLVSMLDPEEIEARILEPRKNTANSTGSLMTLSDFHSHRSRLSKTSLIHVNRDSQKVRVHRLVQTITVRFAVHCGIAAIVFKQAVNRVADQWPFLNRNYITGKATSVSRWQECKLAYPHILRLMEVYAELEQLSVNDLASFDLTELLLEAVQFKLETGLSHEVTQLLDTVKHIYNPEGSHTSTPAENLAKYFRGRIGLAVFARNSVELMKYARKVRDIEVERHRRAGNTISSILAIAYNDLAQAWACQRDWGEALSLLEESRSIRELLPDFSRDKLFSPLYHKALVLQHQAKYQKAEDVINEAIQDRDTIFGATDVSSVRGAALFSARGNIRLARADESREDIKHSLYDHMEAVSRAIRAVGQGNRSTLYCQYHLARVHAKRADYQSACNELEEIQSNLIDRPTYYIDIARSFYLYAVCLKALGNAGEAQLELHRSVDVYNKLRPHEARTTATITSEDIAEFVPYEYL